MGKGCICGGKFFTENTLLQHKLTDSDSKRATVTVNIEPSIVGVGDNPEKKQAEKLAALSAVYQLHELGLVSFPFIAAFRISVASISAA
jgi:hypothetical protein